MFSLFIKFLPMVLVLLAPAMVRAQTFRVGDYACEETSAPWDDSVRQIQQITEFHSTGVMAPCETDGKTFVCPQSTGSLFSKYWDPRKPEPGDGVKGLVKCMEADVTGLPEMDRSKPYAQLLAKFVQKYN